MPVSLIPLLIIGHIKLVGLLNRLLLLVDRLKIGLLLNWLVVRLELQVHSLSDLVDEVRRNLHVLVAALKHRLNLLLHELFDQFILICLLNLRLQHRLDRHLNRRLRLLLVHRNGAFPFDDFAETKVIMFLVKNDPGYF